MERVAESEIFPNWRVFISIFGQGIEEKVEKYSIFYSLLIIYIYIHIRNENEFRKKLAGDRPRGWIRNRPESARLSFHFRPRNQGKGSPHAACNFTIDYLLFIEYRVPNIYFNVENVLIDTQNIVIFNPAVAYLLQSVAIHFILTVPCYMWPVINMFIQKNISVYKC